MQFTKIRPIKLLLLSLIAILVLSGCTSATTSLSEQAGANQGVESLPDTAADLEAGEIATVTFTLQTSLESTGMVFKGVGGEIDGVTNPDLRVSPGDVVELVLINGDGIEHDITVANLNVQTDRITKKDATARVTFSIDTDGVYIYYCSLPGHRQAGMLGSLIVGDAVVAQKPTSTTETSYDEAYTTDQEVGENEASEADLQGEAVSIIRNPTDLPGPLDTRGPENIRYDIESVELEGQLADGTTYTYWTFDSQVPGPFLRVRVGDTVEIHLKNREDSTMAHSIDLHAATGPGGGAAVTQVAPGEEKWFTFKALNPGLYVYHCATPMVAHHIANGMYGLILVEPEEGLPEVDREFYVMQGELYTQEPFGTKGQLQFDIDKLLAEDPEYFFFNGAVGALTNEYPMQANVGETVRIFFGVGGPNFTSSFHVIGEIFDHVYDQASITSNPLTDVQTTLVPAGGATVVDFRVDVPGRYILVDHALSRAERGLTGYLVVDGDPVPEIFFSEETPSGDGH